MTSTRNGGRPRWGSPLESTVGPFVIGVGALFWLAFGLLGVTPNGRRPSDTAGAVVADDVRALLGTLREGEEVGGFELVRVDPVHDQRIPLIFRRDDATARLWIVRQNTIAFEPPAQTRRYAVIYRCDDAEVSSETCGLLSIAVAERLRQTEVEAPVPAEMAPRQD